VPDIEEVFVKKRAQVFLLAFLVGASMIYLRAQQTPDYQGQSGAQQQTPPAQPGQTAPEQQPGQAYPGQQPPRSTQPSQPGTEAGSQASTTSGVQTFTGTIVKSGDKYVFQDESTGKTYDIDHQDTVAQHAGKRVRLNGTLDPSGMIHIQPANH
jgi:uncharacterized protein YdeI (BOF family)